MVTLADRSPTSFAHATCDARILRRRLWLAVDALFGKAMLVKIYMAFTGAENTKLLTDEADGEAWIRAGVVEV